MYYEPYISLAKSGMKNTHICIFPNSKSGEKAAKILAEYLKKFSVFDVFIYLIDPLEESILKKNVSKMVEEVMRDVRDAEPRLNKDYNLVFNLFGVEAEAFRGYSFTINRYLDTAEEEFEMNNKYSVYDKLIFSHGDLKGVYPMLIKFINSIFEEGRVNTLGNKNIYGLTDVYAVYTVYSLADNYRRYIIDKLIEAHTEEVAEEMYKNK